MATEKKLIYFDDARRAILKADPKLAYCIERIKPVDAVEVVHGRWEQNGNFLMCSECYDLYKEREATVFCYCPNCGAKMDGDGNEV